MPAPRSWSPELYEVTDLGFGTPCWIWKGYKNKDGYGHSMWKRRLWSAHRRAWTELRGPIPDGLKIDHLCHDPSVCPGGRDCPHRACVNPDHMQICSSVQNSRRSSKAKLTMDDAREIRARYAAGGISQPALAREYGVVQGNISSVLLGHTWKEDS